eukprot:Skav208043  [mRNA]  locus=scaffold2536:48864:52092:- [translate_table: standard]
MEDRWIIQGNVASAPTTFRLFAETLQCKRHRWLYTKALAAGSWCDVRLERGRQARGRQQRIEKRFDQREGGDGRIFMLEGAQCSDCFDQILKTYQQHVAARMLEDFHLSGVDADLEVLKAGWANHFRERPGRRQPQCPLLADLEGDPEDMDAVPRSFLCAQGERAKQRLQGLEQLLHLAKGTEGTDRGGASSSFGGHPFTHRERRGPLQHAGKLLRAEPRGKESKKECRVKGVKETKSKPGAAPVGPDLWAEWEARWSEEFRRLDEMEKNRRHVIAAEAVWAEREEEWHRRVHAEKAKAKVHAEKAKPSESKARKAKVPERPQPTESPPHEPVQPARNSSKPKVFQSFAEFSFAWGAFEERLSATGTQSATILVSDIPWPDGLASVSGTTSSDTAAEAKRKLRTALLRWHPDKWAPILEHVAEADRAEVIARVKLVTQRLLDERKVHPK